MIGSKKDIAENNMQIANCVPGLDPKEGKRDGLDSGKAFGIV